MAKCCNGAGNNVRIDAGRNIRVTGLGTAQAPFEVASDVVLSVENNSTFDLGLTGSGTLESPWVLTVNYADGSGLDSLPDVNASAPANGHTLVYNSTTDTWDTGPAATASPGAILTDGSLSGNGSSGAVLQVRENAARYLETTASGLGISNAGVNRMVRIYANDANRNADVAVLVPETGTISTVLARPGIYEYWTGTDWAALVQSPKMNNGTSPVLQVSGAYTGGSVTLYNRAISLTTGADGSFAAIPSTDLSGYSGVLDVQVQPTGTTPWVCMASGDTNRIKGVAWGLNNLVRANAPITARVSAVLY